MEKNQFLNRRTAGLELARILKPEIQGGTLVFGMSGGIGPAAVVARYLEVPLYPLFVRALGIPGHDTLSMGALTSQGVQWLDRGIIRQFGISEKVVQKVVQSETLELQRREEIYRKDMYRNPCDFGNMTGKTAVIIDDGIPDSACNILAAIKFVRKYKPRRLLVAAPVISAGACRELSDKCEKLVYLHRPEVFVSVEYWYGQRDPEFLDLNLPAY